ncbi:MAG: isoleucine--tRNA ligase [Defluviitaleaceae bacterium]|nr:isoleucine--tRNA ligase [Defluviitaleaceae bacterium]
MHKKVSTDLNFAQRELDVLKFWEENNIFEKTIANREGAASFSFYEGPPTANGKPHFGHIITRAVKDIIPRYKTMKGYKVLRKAGWDTHGLPVELEVEKELGISGKGQIEDYGVAPFIAKCKESVWKYKDVWETMSNRVGFWLNYDEPYVTYDNTYVESVWWALKTIHDKGLLYKGHKILPYCPRCGTSLSSHEVAQGYKDITEASVVAQFKLRDRDDEYILAWTTTPWTLPSNVALCVNGEENYVRAKKDGKVYILAEALAEKVLGEDHEIIETMKGKALEGLHYVPLFDFVKFDVDSHYIVCDSYVTLSDGTGVVHQAPAFGEDDNRVARKYGLPFVQLVNDAGEMTEETPWSGIFAKTADPQIIEYMKQRDNVYQVLTTDHSYPHCWRCDTPLLYYARSAWFIEMSKLRERLLANNENINWMPENVKTGRFGNFLDGVIDWSLSRERYWGTPLPLWECDCGHVHAIGSVAELKERSGQDIVDMHKPAVDEIRIKCDKCGGGMKRVPEVIDCWFDSGAMPFAQHHYPFENKELFEENFPANFISEAIDQTRGWFYTLLAISTLLFDKNPYENVIVLGHIQDENGQKMSKSKGNVVPWEVVEEFGADTVRWNFFASSAVWLPSKFSREALTEVQRKFLGTLWNTYAFYVLYANIDNFNPTEHKLDVENLPVMDKWVLSRLHALIRLVDEGLEEYKITETAREIARFTDDLSNWYVRRSRERFWGSGLYKDKIDAYMTLYTVLTELSKIVAPYVPFMAEEIYQNLVADIDATAPKSVHLCDFPTYDEGLIDPRLEEDMGNTVDIVVAGRAARNAANIKNRQPLGRMLVESRARLSDAFIAVICEELNIKQVSFEDNLAQYASYKLKPQLKTLGPRYGKMLPKISAYLLENGNALHAQLQQAGEISFEIEGTQVALGNDDLLIEAEQMEGYASQSVGSHFVVLETALTPELIEEGFVREIVSKVQTMRKEAGFDVTDKIKLSYASAATIVHDIMEKHGNDICAEVLAESLTKNESFGHSKPWDINGEEVLLSVEKVGVTCQCGCGSCP